MDKDFKAQKADGVLVLPLITLRGLTITPHARMQITAVRDSSVAAFNQVQNDPDRQIAVFCQLNETDERPDFSAVSKTGVLCKLSDAVPSDRYSVKATLSGYDRIKLLAILDDPNCAYRQAKISMLKETLCDPNDVADTLSVLKSCLQYAMDNSDKNNRAVINQNVPENVVKGVMDTQNLSVFTDMLTQILNIDDKLKLTLLANLNPVERGRILIAAVNGYSYKAELEKHIIEMAKDSMEKTQKEYFLNEQLKAIKKELGNVDFIDDEVAEYNKKAEELNCPSQVKERLFREIKKLGAMGFNSSEYALVRNYIETLLSIPWEQHSAINHDLAFAKQVLDTDHFGLEKVKDRILEYLAVQARADRVQGPILCLMGPPGIGKTSLGESIAKATGRTFVRIALGGIHDESEIRGHRRTYIGAMPGRIIQNLIKAKVNNPLFLLDEIDKVGASTFHGSPSDALLEVLDPEQNKSFEDNYVELEYDLSNVMFVTTANSYNISSPLLDRMDVIDLSSYTEDEKFNIAKRHLLPKQLKANCLDSSEFEIEDEALRYLIVHYTHEAGVRELERLIGELCRKSVRENMLGADPNSCHKTVIAVSDLEKQLGPKRYDFTSRLKENKVGIVNGLAWSQLGGDILQIEAVANIGTGKHQLTGKLGEVMKESVETAISLVRTLAPKLNLDGKFYQKCDLHIHVPEGATPKEGPSAGIGMVTAVVSALTGNKVRADVAMTGEITLRGDVLPIGGLKEKLLAALRGGISTAIIPKENEKDLWDVPDTVKKQLTIKPVSRIEEVLENALEQPPLQFKVQTPWKFTVQKSDENLVTDKAAQKDR